MWQRGLGTRHLLLLILTPLFLCGCWDRVETNDLAFVLTSSIDLEDNGMVRIAYLLPLPGQMGGASGGGGGTSGGKSYYIDSEVGSTIREAATRMQRRIPRRVFLAHRRTIVIGEAYAKRGIDDLFDTVPRLPESRLNTYLVIAKGKGYSLLNAQPKFERFPAEAIRELAKPPYSMPNTMKDVGLALSFGSDPVLAYMETAKTQKGKISSEEIELKGLAQFRSDQMIGLYKNEATLGIYWLSNKIIETTVTFPVESDKAVSIRIIHGTTHISPVLKNGELSFQVDIRLTGKVREDLSELNLNDTGAMHKIEKKLAAYTKKNMQTVIKQMQKSGVDSAHLGVFVRQKYPYEWEQGLQANWREQFSKAKFIIKPEISITESGLINQNVLKEGKKL
jgi:spore germination protein KC